MKERVPVNIQTHTKPGDFKKIGVSESTETACSVAEVTQEMLNAGVKAAVKSGIIPKYAGENEYLKNWDGIKAVIRAALLAR